MIGVYQFSKRSSKIDAPSTPNIPIDDINWYKLYIGISIQMWKKLEECDWQEGLLVVHTTGLRVQIAEDGDI